MRRFENNGCPICVNPGRLVVRNELRNLNYTLGMLNIFNERRISSGNSSVFLLFVGYLVFIVGLTAGALQYIIVMNIQGMRCIVASLELSVKYICGFASVFIIGWALAQLWFELTPLTAIYILVYSCVLNTFLSFAYIILRCYFITYICHYFTPPLIMPSSLAEWGSKWKIIIQEINQAFLIDGCNSNISSGSCTIFSDCIVFLLILSSFTYISMIYFQMAVGLTYYKSKVNQLQSKTMAGIFCLLNLTLFLTIKMSWHFINA
ncbi:hypothetical protein NEHOM01_1568 [Nematocida homosporus]|uniref:uncharacterized protein n=1 Tax=Nematocida homosporus TaxID=1912981 RepID=UPI002220EBE6|nr:uncharacterized protein NEHOM01_1568 [Nematocida homosporus]KAI5186582.1 hypothetical protein NEHOM01_1568 [Nematocida homosporus]